MFTDGPQPTQGAPKKKEEGKSVGCFLGELFFCSLFSFSFFLEAPCAGERALGWSAGQGAAEKIKRENDVHLRQLAKKSTYVLFFFF
jgi:hypothetical protein